MMPVTLRTERLVLDQPTPDDIDLIAQYCSDPVFERLMTTPWPYERKHAAHFVEKYVPLGWEDETEFTWAIRSDSDFLGMIGYRAQLRMIGYWLGAPHRGSYSPGGLRTRPDRALHPTDLVPEVAAQIAVGPQIDRLSVLQLQGRSPRSQ